MNKETLIAAGVGLSLGLIVTVGVYSMKRTLAPNPSNQLSVSPTPIVTENPDSTGNLSLTSPEDGTLVSDSTLTVKGTSSANSSIVLLVGNDEKIIASEANGSFSDQVTLKAGPNILTVIAVNENGETTKVERLVILENSTATVATPSAQTSPTPTAKISPSPTPKSTTKASPSPTIKPKLSITPTPTKKL